MPRLQEMRSNIHTNLTQPETRLSAENLCRLITLWVYVFTQLFSKVAVSDTTLPARKQNLT